MNGPRRSCGGRNPEWPSLDSSFRWKDEGHFVKGSKKSGLIAHWVQQEEVRQEGVRMEVQPFSI